MDSGETIAQYLDRCYVPRAVDLSGMPWMVGDECVWFGVPCEVAGYTDETTMILFDLEEGEWFLAPINRVSRPAANESAAKELGGLENPRDRLFCFSEQPNDRSSFEC